MNTWQILERTEIINQTEDILDEEGNVIVPSREEKTVFTKVEYSLNETIVVVDIPHFMPQSEDDINLGIENRMVTELSKLSNNV
jgi:hypothetical protein